MRIILKPRSAILLGLMLVVLAAVAIARPQLSALPLLGGGNPLNFGRETSLAGTGRDWTLVGGSSSKPSVSYIADNSVPVDAVPVMKVQNITANTKAIWDAQVERDIVNEIPSGQHLVLHFWAYAPQPRPIYAVVEKNAEPYDKDLAMSVNLTPTWQEFTLPFTVHTTHPSRTEHVTFQLSQAAGDVEIGGVSIQDRDGN